MANIRKAWHLLPQNDAAAERLSRELRVNPVVAQLLVNRGVTEPEQAKLFLTGGLAALVPPQRLPGTSEAAAAILDAVAAGRRICVYGDYDVDGVTGTAILVGLIERLGGRAEFYIPNRMEEGYGLNAAAVRQKHADGVGLLVTVDCGVTAIEAAEEARRIGLPLVITDHHEIGPTRPPAVAIVHPRLEGAGYPYESLSGSGVAFKLAWAVAQRVSGGEKTTPELREFLLDAVGTAALGLVADVVPLRDENRILVRYGLERLVTHPSLGVAALCAAAKLGDGPMKAEDIAFRLGPRINAAGRLGCALLVVELLTTKSQKRAEELAACLEGFNTQRQTIERRITAEAKAAVEEAGYHTQPAIVLSRPDWHQGVIGIVAGRLVEAFGRPTILISERPNDEVSTGSGRSVPGFDLHAALQASGAELEGFGGHAMAAGVKVKPSNVAAFRERFVRYAAEHWPVGPPRPRLRIDAEIPLSAITFGLLKDIDRLEPYGADNPKPRFLASGLTVEGTPRMMGTGERHMSFRVRQSGGSIRAVAFGMGERREELMAEGGKCCLVFTPRLNEWNGQQSVEIEVVDLVAGPRAEIV